VFNERIKKDIILQLQYSKLKSEGKSPSLPVTRKGDIGLTLGGQTIPEGGSATTFSFLDRSGRDITPLNQLANQIVRRTFTSSNLTKQVNSVELLSQNRRTTTKRDSSKSGRSHDVISICLFRSTYENTISYKKEMSTGIFKLERIIFPS
jgi:hypothetical protein